MHGVVCPLDLLTPDNLSVDMRDVSRLRFWTEATMLVIVIGRTLPAPDAVRVVNIARDLWKTSELPNASPHSGCAHDEYGTPTLSRENEQMAADIARSAQA